MNSVFQFSIDKDGICKVLFDTPGEKVNKLNRKVLKDFDALIEELKKHQEIKALLFMSEKTIAGADLNEFIAAFKDPEIAIDLLTNARASMFKWKTLPFPTIFLINGLCIGGGLELALLCNYRIVSDHPQTSLSFPETTIGIIPGWGGTQETPRLIGLAKATEMIVSGRPLNAIAAYKAHLADAIAAPEFLEEKGREFAHRILTEKGKKKVLSARKKRGLKNLLLENNPLGRALLFSQFRKAILKKTKGFYPAPLIALGVVENTWTLPIEQGLKIEFEAFTKLFKTDMDIPRNLVSIFFGREKLKKTGGYTGEIPAVESVSNAAVLGAGAMGGGIAFLLARTKIPVRLKDISWELIGKGISASWEQFHKLIKRKKLKQGEAEIRFHNTSWTLDYTGFEKKNFILEAIVENLDLKSRVYQELEQKVPKETIIATNTSSLRVAELCSKMEHPERFIGMHFFIPAPVMPLVEIVPGPKTSPETLAKTLDLAKKMGKIPLVVKDCNGFLVNRILLMGAFEVLHLIEEGASVEEIDHAALAFGLPMGMCEVMDFSGLDVCYHAARDFHQAYGERMAVPPLLTKLYEAKHFGQKTGKGLYLYKGKTKKVNPEFQKSKKENVNLERPLMAMLNEASRCLEEQIVHEPAYVDLSLVLGAGFPPFRGGILRYADKLGLKTVYDTLKDLENVSAARFTPTQMIERLARDNQTFYKD